MTGIGSYFYIVWAIYLRHCLNERQDEFVLRWPSYFSIPEVVPQTVAEKSNGFWKSCNGYSSKEHVKSEDRKSV
jgi:dihydroceramidase